MIDMVPHAMASLEVPAYLQERGSMQALTVMAVMLALQG